MYKIKFLVRIDTSKDDPKKVYHSAVYNDANIKKVAAQFISMGMRSVESVEVLKLKDSPAAKLTPEEVIELFYPEEKVLPSGDKVVISDEDKERKEKAKDKSAKKPKEANSEGDDDELKAKREKAKGLGIKSAHVMGEEKLNEKIAEAEAKLSK